jgi:acetyltransferase-like isoleucine patch superfamily enzyme
MGKLVHIGKNVDITCKHVEIGDGCFIADRVIIEGEYFNMGKNGFIGFEAYIDGRNGVMCGENVCIGPRAMIYTHANWNNVLEGWYCAHKQVIIGHDSWIGARAIVLPGVSIGDGCMLTVNSVATHNIPAHSVATGNPAKVIIENYPKKPSPDRRLALLKEMCKELQGLGFNVSHSLDEITLLQGNQYTFFDLKNKIIHGEQNKTTDELREYLRKRGIKFEGLWRYRSGKKDS